MEWISIYEIEVEEYDLANTLMELELEIAKEVGASMFDDIITIWLDGE